MKTIKNKSELAKAIKGMDKALVLFYASWCPYSQRFLPVFNLYAKTDKNHCLQVILDDMEDVCDDYSISVYPTVLLFEKGKVTKRLDGISGRGLNGKQLSDFIGACGLKKG